MIKFAKILILSFLMLMLPQVNIKASENNQKTEELNVREFILEHVSDSYEWHITSFNHRHISIPLPIIIYSNLSGWHVFMSSVFHHEPVHEGLYIAKEGKYKNKIVEKNSSGTEIKPFDISITKNVFSLLIGSFLVIFLIMKVAKSYQKHGYKTQTGFISFMEMIIMNINDDVIKPCIGKGYKPYAPYLLTVFFFIFVNNLLGLIPIFPGGANVTGNIAITFVLSVVTFLIVNLSGSKEYWREIFWPDVPMWLKIPIPLMPVIEFVGIITKPFALMLRLFANMLAGHSLILGLTCLIFISVKFGLAGNAGMTALSVVFSVFIDFVELLVAYIQAYIFTMLSAVFIGLAKIEPHHKPISHK